MNLPPKVEALVKEITEKSPDYSEAQVWATAWSIYCKHVKPGDGHCSKGPEGYFTKKAAISALLVLAHERPEFRKHIVPFIKNASLADKVMGTDWRKGPRKADQAQTPNDIDTAAARYKDRLEASLNEFYRSTQPALIPPTLNLLHGHKYIRLVLSDGDLTRTPLAFISRSTGQVYNAEGWEAPTDPDVNPDVKVTPTQAPVMSNEFQQVSRNTQLMLRSQARASGMGFDEFLTGLMEMNQNAIRGAIFGATPAEATTSSSGLGNPVANVLDVKTWGVRTAFDQYNVPELLAQLKSVLLKKGLDDVWGEIKSKGIPRLVNDAWMGLSKKERKRRADRVRLASLRRSRIVLGADIRKVLADLFQGHQPYVKDWTRFIKAVASELPTWPSQWSSGIKGFGTSERSTTIFDWSGQQTSQGWDTPPEYEEATVDVAESVSLKFGAELDLRKFPADFTKSFRSLVTDARGFQQATVNMLNSPASVTMLGKLLMAGLKNYIKADPMEAVDGDAWESVEDEARGMGDTRWDVTYEIYDVLVGRVQFKVMGANLRVWADADVILSVSSLEPPEPSFDDDDYRMRRRARVDLGIPSHRIRNAT